MAESRTLRVARTVERAIGEPLERAVESPAGADTLATLTKVASVGSNSLERLRGGVLHAGGLATQRDVALLEARLARIEQVLEELAHRLDEARG
jgi:hypothetical protein